MTAKLGKHDVDNGRGWRNRPPIVAAVAIAALALLAATVSLQTQSGVAGAAAEAEAAPIEHIANIEVTTPVNVALRVSNPLDQPRRAEPVSTGVPLSRGQITDVSKLWLQNPTTGSAVPAQFTVTSRWNGPPNDETKSIKWVTVDLKSDVAAKGRADYVLRSAGGQNSAPLNPVTVTDSTEELMVDTGPLKFAVPKTAFGSLFDGIWLDSNGDGTHETEVASPGSGGGMVLTRADGSQYRSTTDNGPDAGAAHTVEVEVAGPMHTIVKLSGKHYTDAQNQHCPTDYQGCIREQFNYLNYTVRIHAYANTPYVRVFYSLTNPERFLQGHYNSGGERLFQQWDGLSLDLQLNTAQQPLNYTIGGETPDNHEYVGTKASASGVGADSTSGSLPAASTVEIYQDSSGVENWQDTADKYWGTSFRGYELYKDDQPGGRGLQASGWATVESDRWAVGVGVRHFWGSVPKGWELDGTGRVGIDLWPSRSRDIHTFSGGRQKTHEFIVGAWHNDVAPEEIQGSLTGSLEPMHALATSEQYVNTQALGLVAAESDGTDPRFTRYEQTTKAMVDRPGEDIWAERFDEDLYGWRNWGDAYRGGSKADNSARYFGNNEFDLTYANLVNYLRSDDHDPRLFALAESQARQLYDIDTYHTAEDAPAYSHGVHKHDASGVIDHGRAPNLSHFWIRGLLDYYLLTGDRFALDAATETGQWIDNLVDDTTGDLLYNYESRSQAWALLALTELWETTGESRYLTMAGQLAKAEIIDEQGLSGAQYPCSDLDWEGDRGTTDKQNVAPWQNGYVAEALGRYAMARRVAGNADQPAETALLRLLDAIAECGWATPDNGKFVAGNGEKDNDVYGTSYEQLVINRLQSNGDYDIAFAVNQTLTDGFAYGYIFSNDRAYAAMADATWTWTMGPERHPGVANPYPTYYATSTAAKNAGFRQRFGQTYLWLAQRAGDQTNGGGPGGGGGTPSTTTASPATTSTTTSTSATQEPTTTTTEAMATTQASSTHASGTQASSTTQPPETTVVPSTTRPNVDAEGYRLDFEQRGSERHFKPLGSNHRARRVALDGGGHGLAISANNNDRAYLFRADKKRVTLDGSVSMQADMGMAYYGSSTYGVAGPSHGLLLKTLPSGRSTEPDAYIASVFPDGDGITLRIGAVRGAKAGTATYQFLNPGHGHSAVGHYSLFNRTFKLENRTIELGTWNLAAELTSHQSRTTITVTLTDPSGKQEVRTWVDEGPKAYSGPGSVGLVSAGVWSIENRYDNIQILG